MNVNLTKLVAVCMLLITTGLFAQRKADKVVEFDSNLDQIEINEQSGVVIVKGNDDISGVDSDSGKVVWNYQLREIFSSNTQNEIMKYLSVENSGDLVAKAFGSSNIPIYSIGNTSYIEAYRNGSYAVINSKDGNIIFSTIKNDAYVLDHHYIPEINGVLLTFYGKPKSVIAVSNEQISIGLLNLNKGEMVWEKPLTESDKMLSIFSSSFDESKFPPISPKIDKRGDIYFYLKNIMMKINSLTGDVYWGKEVKQLGVNEFYITNNEKYIVQLSKASGLGGLIGTKANLMVVNAVDGSNVWDDEMKIKTPVYFEDMGDNFLLASNSGFNLYSFFDGQKKWKKGPKGNTKQVVKTEGGYIFIEDENMQFVNNEGEDMWRKDVKISDNKDDAIYVLDEEKGKIVYITGTYANIVDKKSGETIWKKNLKFNEKRPLIAIYDEVNNGYLVYNDEELFKFDFSTVERPEAFSELKLKREKEINNLEKRGDYYLVSGERELALLNKEGALKYQKYYKESGNRRLYKSLLIGAQVGIGIGSSTWETSDSQGNVTGRGGLFTDEKTANALGEAYEGMGQASDQFNKKNLSANSQNVLYFFTDESSDSKKVLVAVDKNTGEEIDKYSFNNSQPKYELDELRNKIYYLDGNKLHIFSL